MYLPNETISTPICLSKRNENTFTNCQFPFSISLPMSFPSGIPFFLSHPWFLHVQILCSLHVLFWGSFLVPFPSLYPPDLFCTLPVFLIEHHFSHWLHMAYRQPVSKLPSDLIPLVWFIFAQPSELYSTEWMTEWTHIHPMTCWTYGQKILVQMLALSNDVG